MYVLKVLKYFVNVNKISKVLHKAQFKFFYIVLANEFIKTTYILLF